MEANKLLFYILINVLAVCIARQCSSFTQCGECVSSRDSHCVWCSSKNLATKNQIRCQERSYADATSFWCRKEDIIDNHELFSKNNTLVKKSEGFRPAGPSWKAVQLNPQHISATAYPGAFNTFNISYKPAAHYPIDVYFLMDSSYTMRERHALLKRQALSIYNMLSNLTNNVQFGLGSFVDKFALPYSSVNGEKNSYSFKNHLELTNNLTLFPLAMQIVNGSNLDNPEGSLDALMQVMTCTDKIGWRKGARKVIILCTDGPFHSAGDGRMVGAVQPNDMKCHNDPQSYLEQDYPSVGQIKEIAMKENYLIYFATPKSIAADYKDLANAVHGVYVELEVNSDLVQILKHEYLKLVGNLLMDVQYSPSDSKKYVKLKMTPNCDETNCPVDHNATLTQYTIDTSIQVSCPDNAQNHKVRLTVNPRGLKDTLTIDIDIICTCACEASTTLNSANCSNHGTYKCGICTCNEDRYGSTCECNGSTKENDLEKCKQHKGDSVCSGQGTCRCGQCIDCMPGRAGAFCELSHTSCGLSDSKMCGGHGRCEFGQCICDEPWTSDVCSCYNATLPCIAPLDLLSNQVCSGNGECICGKCECKGDKNPDQFCADERCDDFADYVRCSHAKKPNCNENFKLSSRITLSYVSKTELTWNKASWTCQAKLENGSFIVFKYGYDGHDNIVMAIQKDLEDAPVTDILIPAVIAVGVGLLIGLITVIIWKILVDRHDAKEFIKFAQESEMAGYEIATNPLYTSPAVNFSNPAYQNNIATATEM